MQERIRETNRFPFYREFWTKVLIWAIIASACVPFFQAVTRSGAPLLLPVFWALGIALATVFWLRSYCEFKDDHLLVVVGPVFEKFEYRHITAVKTTIGAWARGERPRARFALYVNRVLRRYISPRDPAGFLKLFKEKCPDAQVD